MTNGENNFIQLTNENGDIMYPITKINHILYEGINHENTFMGVIDSSFIKLEEEIKKSNDIIKELKEKIKILEDYIISQQFPEDDCPDDCIEDCPDDDCPDECIDECIEECSDECIEDCIDDCIDDCIEDTNNCNDEVKK